MRLYQIDIKIDGSVRTLKILDRSRALALDCVRKKYGESINIINVKVLRNHYGIISDKEVRTCLV